MATRQVLSWVLVGCSHKHLEASSVASLSHWKCLLIGDASWRISNGDASTEDAPHSRRRCPAKNSVPIAIGPQSIAGGVMSDGETIRGDEAIPMKRFECRNFASGEAIRVLKLFECHPKCHIA